MRAHQGTRRLPPLSPSASDIDERSTSDPGRFTLVPFDYETGSAPEVDWKILEYIKSLASIKN